MVWKLGDLCLHYIQENLGVYPNLGSSLPNLYKEVLIERLACHDRFFPHHVCHISNSLFSSSLRHINLQRCDQITDSVLKLLGWSRCKLELLKMVALDEVTDAGVRCVVEGQDALQVLHLTELPLITDKVLSYIKSPELWSFKMTHQDKKPWLSDTALASFCELNPSIKIMKISGGTDNLAVIAQGLTSLEELNLNFQTITDEGIEILAENCPNLKKLDLNGARHISKDSVVMLFQACTQMEELDLGYCTNLTVPKEREVFWTLPQSLKTLSLVGCNLEDENIFVESITRLHNVVFLKLCGVTALNDSTMEKIVSKIGSQLLELNVSGLMTSDFTDEGLKSVTKYCTRLESLHISLLMNVTGASLVPIFTDPSRAARIRCLAINSKMMEVSVLDQVVASCPNLDYLNLSGLAIVTDNMVITLADRSPKLTNLCVKGCKLMEVSVVDQVVSSCPNIESLNMSGLGIVTDSMITTLADHSPKLSKLRLKQCKMLTDKSICYLCGRCPLKMLVLSGLHALTDKSIFCIASSCPQLEEIYLDACAQVTPVALRYLQDQCLKRLWTKHAIPNASPNQVMGKNIDTGEFCRLDLL